MKYLKKVIIKNFQSHKDSIIEFDQGLNVIVGPSDSGKSAIIRAIKWALYNEPAGDYFIREGEKEASVVLEFSNNIKIKRLRSKSKNAYIIYNNNDDELVYEGFGNKVPQEIIELIGIEKIPLDTNESNAINLGEQLEGAFLLSEKASTRASAIGRLVGVNLIDDALKETLKDLRNISIEKKTVSERIKIIEEELITFNYLDNLKEDISTLEYIVDNIRTKTNMKNKLISILDDYKKIKQDKKETNYIKDSIKNINVLEKNIYILESRSKDLNLYNKLNISLYEIKNQIFYNKNIVNNLANNKCIEKNVAQISLISEKLAKLEIINNKIINYKKQIKQTLIDLEKLKHINSISDKVKYAEQSILKFKNLNILFNNLTALYKNINIGEKYLQRLDKLYEAELLLRNISKLADKINLVINSSKKFEKVRIEINEQNNILKDCKNNIDNNLKKYEILLKKNKTCPFCLSIINEDKIKHIIKHYN